MQIEFASTTLPTILLWGIGLLVFLIGGLLGYFNVSADARKKLNEADQKLNAARAEAERKISEAQQKLEEARTLTAQSANEPALLRLKSDDGFRVQIEMDDKPLSAPLTPERRKRLIELIGHVRPWLEGATAAPQAATPQTPISRPLTAPPSAPAPVPVPPVSPTLKPVPATLSLTPQKPKTDPVTEFKLLSIVKQIDAVLQTRIAGTPLESIGLHLQETPQGALEVLIGTRKFESIDDVPDANIKDAIRAAIAEWEQKYVPGA